jgi:hypothetical protein
MIPAPSVRISCREPEAEKVALSLAAAWLPNEKEWAERVVMRDWPLMSLKGLTLHWAPHATSRDAGALLVSMSHVPGGKPIIEWIEGAAGHPVKCSAG